MSEWKEYKLGDIATRIGDGLHGTPQYDENGEYYFINGNNIANGKVVIKNETRRVSTEEYEKYLKPLANNTILLSINGTIGNIGLYNGEKCMLGKSACYINLKEGVNRNFVYYNFVNKDFQEFLQGIATGTTIPNVPLKGLREYDIKLPSSEEQERIAGILSSLDDKIDLLTRQNCTLESMAETLFRQYFIENPKEDWKDGVIADMIDFNPTRKLSKGTVAPFLEMSNLSTTTYAPNGWYDRAFSSGTKFKNGDTLLARITPCLENGKTAYVDFLEEEQVAWGSTEYIVMCTKGELHPFFAYIVAKYQDFRDYAESCMSGSSGRQRVDVDNLKGYEIKMPDSGTIKQFNVCVESIVGKMNCNNNQIRNLTKLRDTLLPKLMNNEVKIHSYD